MDEKIKELGWSVGRFVYQKGASTPLHFMELKDFQVDCAQSIVEVIELRTIRTRLQSELPIERVFEDTKKISWNHLAAGIATKIIMSDFQAAQHIRIVEIHSGIGVLYETMKLNLEYEGLKLLIDHVGIGSDDFRRQYGYIQGLDEYGSRYIEETESSGEIMQLCQDADLVVFNGAEALTHRGQQTIDLQRIVSAKPKRLLVTSWVAGHENEGNRTSVKRRDVTLPTISDLILIMEPISLRGQPVGELLDGAFGDFFLPEPDYDDGKIGFFMACAGSSIDPMIDLKSMSVEL